MLRLKSSECFAEYMMLLKTLLADKDVHTHILLAKLELLLNSEIRSRARWSDARPPSPLLVIIFNATIINALTIHPL